MEKYFVQGAGLSRPNLFNEVRTTELRNISLTGGANIGDVLAGASGVFQTVASNSDKNKVLCIAAEDVTDTSTTITTAYFAGKFNIGALSFGGADVDALEDNLRKSNIILGQNLEV